MRLMQRSDGPVYLYRGLIAHGRSPCRRSFRLPPCIRRSLALAIAADYASHRGWQAAAAKVVGLATVRSMDRARHASIRIVRFIGSRSIIAPAPSSMCRRKPGNRARYEASPAGMELCRQCRALDLSDGRCAAIRRCGPRCCGALSLPRPDRRIDRRLIGTLRIGIEDRRLGFALSRLAGMASLAGHALQAFRLDLDIQRLALDGRRPVIFNRQPRAGEAASIAGIPAWDALPHDELQRVSAPVREVEWFAFGGRIYRRERPASMASGYFLPTRRTPYHTQIKNFCERMKSTLPPSTYRVPAVVPLSLRPMTAMQSPPACRMRRYSEWCAARIGSTSMAADGALLEKLDASRRPIAGSTAVFIRLTFRR